MDLGYNAAQTLAATVACDAGIKPGERSAAKREARNAVPCRCAGTDAGVAPPASSAHHVRPIPFRGNPG
jgi:hypothetical protein